MTIWFVVLGLLQGAFASETYEFYNGVRGLGMGGCQIAVVNDETSLLVNPAGLGKLRDYFLTVADPEIHIGAQTQSIIGSSLTMPLDPQEVMTQMSRVVNQSKRMHSGVQVFPSAVFPNFGVGFYGSYFADASIDADNSLFSYRYRSDLALVFGFNFRIWDGRIKFGFNTRIMNRNEIDRTDIATASTGNTIESLAKEGVGIASDVGLIFSMPWDLIPTLALVYKDVGNTHYNVRDGIVNNINIEPDATLGSLDAALAIFPIAGRNTRVAFTLEYRDALNPIPDPDPMKKYHAGIEFNFSDALFLRAGWNQRYYTAGLELSVANYQLQFATYGEEVGTATAHQEDRRYVGKFAYRF